MSFHRLSFATVAVVSAVLTACAHTLIIPQPVGGPGAAMPPLPVSQIDVPLTADVRQTLAQLESQVPTTFGTDGQFRMVGPSPVGVRYEVHREPFRFTARNGALHAEAVITLRAEACLGAPLGISLPFLGNGCTPVASCGVHEAPRQVVVSADTSLRLDPSWRLVSETHVGTPVFRDRCLLTAFHIDVTDLAAQLVADQVTAAAQRMDQGFSRRGDLRPRAEAFWASLQQPVDVGEGFWLSLAPEGVHAGAFTLTPDTVRTTVGITARPHVSAGAPSQGSTPLLLPDLQPLAGSTPGDTGTPGGTITADGAGFRLTLDAAVPFAEATAMIAQQFQGRTMELDGHRALVRGIRVRGAGGALVFAIDVTFTSGPFADQQGTVYLAGLPDYDPGTGDLVVRDLDYTLETRNVLLQAGEWLMRASLRTDLAARARFPLGARIARLRANAQNALRRNLAPGTDLQGTLTEVHPLGAYVTADAIVLRVEALGTAQVTQDLSGLGLTGPAPAPAPSPVP